MDVCGTSFSLAPEDPEDLVLEFTDLGWVHGVILFALF
jgi:hypothetical protein